MRFQLAINQLRLEELGLAGQVRSEALLLLDYLHGWAVQPKAERIEIDGLLAVWIDSGNAIRENPQLFKAERNDRTNENRLCRYLGDLVRHGLVRVYRRRNRRFVAITELGASLFDSPRVQLRRAISGAAGKGLPRAPEGLQRGAVDAESPCQGVFRTGRRDELITANRDEKRRPHIDEQKTKEENPLTPASGGEGVDFLVEEIAALFGQTSEALRSRIRLQLVAELKRLNVSADDLDTLRRFMAANADHYQGNERQWLRGRKRKLSTFAADFGHQLALARKFSPTPPKPEPEPHGWQDAMREMFINPVIPARFSELEPSTRRAIRNFIDERAPAGWQDAARELFGDCRVEWDAIPPSVQQQIREHIAGRAA